MANPTILHDGGCYDWDGLNNAFTHMHVQLMCQTADATLLSPTFREAVQLIRRLSTSEMSAMAMEGSIYRTGRAFDDGDYAYSLLFCFMLRRSDDGVADEHVSMREIFYEHPEALPSDDGVELMQWQLHGNIIRCMLAICRRTGDAVNEIDKRDRIECHADIRGFCDSWSEVMRSLSRECVALEHRPPAHMVVDFLYVELGVYSRRWMTWTPIRRF